MKKFKPTTPGTRGTKLVSYRTALTTSAPKKSLTNGVKRSVGRNAFGRITTRHKGSGHKRLYRQIDFKYDKFDIPAKIESIEYDPNRSAFISLVCYRDGERRYVLSPKSLKQGDTFTVSDKAPVKVGNRIPLARVPLGTFVYNIELHRGGGSKIARSAGNFAEVIAIDAGKAHLKMPSGEIRKVDDKAYACIGEVGNHEHKLRNLGKAGRSRWLGIRPTVRGSVMNPVDHPHGGGEGRQGIGLRRGPKTPWGKQALGVRTRKAKKYSNIFIVGRRKQGKKRR